MTWVRTTNLFAMAMLVASAFSAKADDGAALQAIVAKYGLASIADRIELLVAQDEARPIVEKVRGYLTFHGFKIGPTNPDILVVALRSGNQAETAHGLVMIGARAPEACRGRLIAHEATHFFLGRDYGRLSNDPEVEALANTMERLVVPEYLPNCGDSN